MSVRCMRQESGVIELYFYGELDQPERDSFEAHMSACGGCRSAFEELSLIRTALAARPVVAAPPGGDWQRFMARLDDAVRFEEQTRGEAQARQIVAPSVSERRSVAPYLAMAAAAMLVTSAIVYYAARSAPTGVAGPSPVVVSKPAPAPASEPAVVPTATSSGDSREAAFAAMSEQHVVRSKLVVLGLANKDARRAGGEDWAYERGLASNLLSDTRFYKLAAEERGMKSLAGVMGDLELVLLQTSLVERPNHEALEQIQRLIHKRDLVTKMEVATAGS